MGDRRKRPEGFDAFEVVVGDEKLVVLSIPIEASDVLDRLTPAEREVATLVVRGLTNEQVATRRGCRARTVAVQLASIYRKLAINSRAVLAVLLAGEGFAPPA